MLLVCAVTGRAKLIPSYRMESLILLSDVVVYCEEEDVKTKDVPHEYHGFEGSNKMMDTITITRCKVLQVFKGDLAPGAEITIQYGGLFCRYLFNNGQL